jgi:MSHA pilin protein MshA
MHRSIIPFPRKRCHAHADTPGRLHARANKVEMNAAGYPTNAGILVAAGLSDHYDTRVAGVIAADAQHPDCSLAYAPESGTIGVSYGDGADC